MIGFLSVFRWLALISVALSASERMYAQLYSVRDLGAFSDLAGRSDGKPNAINAGGKITASNVTNGTYRGWIYGGGWTNLGTLGGAESLAGGINISNRVVGYSRDAGGNLRGFVWTPGGTDGVAGNPQMKAIGTFGGSESAAFGINRTGQIAGYAQTPSLDHAFRYSGGILTDIGALLPVRMVHSYAYGINDAGGVVGDGYDDAWGRWEAFYYDGTNAVGLGTFGARNSSALAINNRNVIVGYYSQSNGIDRAYRYANGAMTELGTLGGAYSYALGINNSNVIVGGSFTDSKNTIFHAFLWATNTMLNLNSRLDASGTGWTLVEARAINDAGQIVGIGTRGGTTRGFLLTPAGPPQITQQPGNVVAACGGNALFSLTASPEPVVCRWFKGNPPTGTAVAGGTNLTLLLTNLTATQAGNYYAIVTNSNGSATSSVATLSVIDNTPPTITGRPGNQTNYILPDASNAVVTWTNPTAIDACDGTVLVTCIPTNGSRFPEGVNTVTCEARDSSLNTTNFTFTVTVVKLPAPTVASAEFHGADFLVTFSTASVGQYALQSSPTLVSGSWSNVVSGIAGTGGFATITNRAAANQRNQFYRLKFALP